MGQKNDFEQRLERVNKELDDAKRVAAAGESLYQELFEQGVLGKSGFVAIHVASKQFICGDTREEVKAQYKTRFGNDPYYLRMIGGLEYAGNIEFGTHGAR